MIPRPGERRRSIAKVLQASRVPLDRIALLQHTIAWRSLLLYPKPQRGRARALRPERN